MTAADITSAHLARQAVIYVRQLTIEQVTNTCGMRMAPLPDAFRSRCKNERLQVAGVDEAVWTTVRDLLLNSQTFADDLTAWASHASTASPEHERQLQQAETRAREIERQRERLTDAYQLGALALEVFRTRMQSLESSRLAAESTLSEVRAEHLASEVAQSRAFGALTVAHPLRPALMNADSLPGRPSCACWSNGWSLPVNTWKSTWPSQCQVISI